MTSSIPSSPMPGCPITAPGHRSVGRHGPARRLPVAGALAALLVAQVACGSRDSQVAAQDRPAVAARVVTVTARQVTEPVDVGGIVQAGTTATLASRIMASVREVRVRPGDRVVAGQPLVLLDDRDLAAGARQARMAREAAEEALKAAEAELEGARAALALARATHDRIAGLRERNSATAAEFDQAVAGLRGAESRVAAAEAQLRQARAAQASATAASDLAGTAASFAVVTAPFAGLVTEKFVEPGNLVGPGSPLVRLEDTRAFRLDVRVDASRITPLSVGDRLAVRLEADGRDGAGQVLEGTITELARAVDADARAVLVKIALPSVDLRSGMFGRAELPGPSREALVVPATAVIRRGQVTSVFVAEEGRARLRLVHLGASLGGEVVVLAGLAAGEAVVDMPPPGLVDGQRLTLQSAASGGHAR